MMVLCRALVLALVCGASGAKCQAGDACEAVEETSLLQRRAMEASLASGAGEKRAWLKAKKARELKRGNVPARKPKAPPQQPVTPQEPALASIEERVLSGTNLQRHRQRLREHLVHTRKETEAVADRLVELMERGVLGMWDPEDPQAIADTYIVTLRSDCETDGSPAAHAGKMEEEVKGTEGETLLRVFHDAADGFTARVPRGTGLLRLGEDGCVQSVEQDYMIRLEPEETEAGASSQTDDVPWGLDHIDGAMDGTYSYENTGAGTYVYVVDTGIQISHDEFQDGDRNRAVAGADTVDPQEDFNSGDLLGNSCGGDTVGSCASPGEAGCRCGVIPEGASSCSGHGTHCAGTVAGRTVGVAKGATVVAVRVLNCRGSGTSSAVLGGMDYAVRMKSSVHPEAPTVISMSLGGPRPPESYSDPSRDVKYSAVVAAKALGVTVVVAAGNSGVDADTRSPAHIDDAITVCASNVNDQRAYFSCFGPGVDLCAPGYQVNSATSGANDAYAVYSGTSMATPHVAGVLALMLENNGGWTVDEQAVELTHDCAEEDAIDMLEDDYSANYCTPGEVDDRCNAFDDGSNCHGCNESLTKCSALDSYTPGSGEDIDVPCGFYSSNSDNSCQESCPDANDLDRCYYGVCVCNCGGMYCDATYLWGSWLQFCCSTYWAQCDPDVVTSTPNKVQNLFGKGSQCAAAVRGAQAPPATTTTTTTTLPPGWQFSGNCEVSGGCVQSLGYPSDYGNNDECTISWNAQGRPTLSSVDLQTEAGFDTLTVNGQAYSGTEGPPIGTTVEGDMRWYADYTASDKGWRLCVEGGPAPPPASSSTSTTISTSSASTTARSTTSAGETTISTGSASTTARRTTISTSSASTTAISTSSASTTTSSASTAGPSPPGDFPWSVIDGDCTMSGRCIRSPNRPDNYDNDQVCTIQVSPANTLPLEVKHFETENMYDNLIINGEWYSGSRSRTEGTPPPEALIPTANIEWESDFSIQDSGWEICLGGDNGTATTVPTTAATTTVATTAAATTTVATTTAAATTTVATTAAATTTVVTTTVAWDGWEVRDGNCAREGMCVSSPGFPGPYPSEQHCKIRLSSTPVHIRAEAFETETRDDFLRINGRRYWGSMGSNRGLPESGVTVTEDTIRWKSNSGTPGAAWRICAEL